MTRGGWYSPLRLWPVRAPVGPTGLALLLILAYVGSLLATMATPTGGSSKLIINGTNCTLVEPLYNVSFDFRELSSDLRHHVMSDRKEHFIFNVCNDNQPAALLVRQTSGSNVTLGYSANLRLEDGRIHFGFEGEPCTGGGTNTTTSQRYTLDLILLCSYDRTQIELNVIPYSPDQCHYYIFWTTPYACLPLPESLRDAHCTVRNPTDSQHTFNLSPLANVNHQLSDGRGSHFLVSVCKPLHYGHLAMCPPGSGVCFVNGSATDVRHRYIDYGQMVANPTIDTATGQLMMQLNSSTERCDNSRIVFECAPGNVPGQDEGPQYIGKDNCTHEFRWRTALACNRTPRPCTVENPITGTVYDLEPLANRVYNLTEGNRNYQVAVCQMPETITRCPPGSGSCEIVGSQSDSYGDVNSLLQHTTTGAPFLLYESGALCRDGRRWKTKLEFICETDRDHPTAGGMMVAPRVVESGDAADCQLVVQFETVLVCEPPMQCRAFNRTADDWVDLTPLVKSVGNYEVQGAGRRFLLNVCRPLVPQYGLSCRGGAAACAADFDGTTYRNETTLGFPDVSLTVAEDTVLLRYLRGDRCPSDPHANASSTITFRCRLGPTGFGHPVLTHIEADCHHRFDWNTSVVCPGSANDVRFDRTECSLINVATGSLPLHLNQIMVANGNGTGSQNAQFVPEALCNGGTSPRTWVDYGTATLQVQFNIASNATCETATTKGTKSYNLTLVCGNVDAAMETIMDSECQVSWRVQTKAVCGLVGREAPTINEEVTVEPLLPPDQSPDTGTTVQHPTVTPTPAAAAHPSGEGGAAGGHALGIVLISLGVCLVVVSAVHTYLVWRKPEYRRRSGPALVAFLTCRHLRGQSERNHEYRGTAYTRVDNNEVSSLLLNAADVSNDTDDDMLI
ncbi:cation-independent mannose-6-phosphate receptor [Anopheles aquasalis]|uniref:cation-independent mannose-6-phosphate receptor n=1 Tax=Anopheles aquasalis TaxID=42839 RepID=UPI00215B0EB3|nr:cation-independent mannose-6-phosphate receptor [Anopheles aquasalis]XP_050082397.1 cation-independent mannose-6-phosphate receptor [Anopheles aquasalis]XP_050082407.1 cation-independent mannose-6-phosphate receptor [Anopheles aquasalis]